MSIVATLLAVAALLAPRAPAADPLPSPLPSPPDDQGCVIPVGAYLDQCPRRERAPLVSCFVPVTWSVPPSLEPACPDHVPDPRGRVVPITP